MKTVDFSGTIAASDLKVLITNWVNEDMSEYLMSRSFFDLGPRSFTC